MRRKPAETAALVRRVLALAAKQPKLTIEQIAGSAGISRGYAWDILHDHGLIERTRPPAKGTSLHQSTARPVTQVEGKVKRVSGIRY